MLRHQQDHGVVVALMSHPSEVCQDLTSAQHEEGFIFYSVHLLYVAPTCRSNHILSLRSLKALLSELSLLLLFCIDSEVELYFKYLRSTVFNNLFSSRDYWTHAHAVKPLETFVDTLMCSDGRSNTTVAVCVHVLWRLTAGMWRGGS